MIQTITHHGFHRTARERELAPTWYVQISNTSCTCPAPFAEVWASDRQVHSASPWELEGSWGSRLPTAEGPDVASCWSATKRSPRALTCFQIEGAEIWELLPDGSASFREMLQQALPSCASRLGNSYSTPPFRTDAFFMAHLALLGRTAFPLPL